MPIEERKRNQIIEQETQLTSGLCFRLFTHFQSGIEDSGAALVPNHERDGASPWTVHRSFDIQYDGCTDLFDRQLATRGLSRYVKPTAGNSRNGRDAVALVTIKGALTGAKKVSRIQLQSLALCKQTVTKANCLDGSRSPDNSRYVWVHNGPSRRRMAVLFDLFLLFR